MTDDASLQLQHDLEGATKRALGIRRPVLTHINADTTWLIQLPYPAAHPHPNRSFYNILIDPWLDGPQSDVASWFSTQWHAIKSSVRTISELDGVLENLEDLAEGQVKKLDRQSEHVSRNRKHSTYIDAVAISHEFTDHCHKSTLLEIDPSVPVFATEKAASLIRSWNHFHQVHLPASFSTEQLDWKKTSTAPLPAWIGISRIVADSDALYFHSALLFAFDISSRSSPLWTKAYRDETAEAIIYSPHGINADDLCPLPRANPPMSTLALMHGLHEVGITLSKQLNLGAYNGLRAQRICRAKYWVATHDEVKIGRGILAPFLRRTVITIPEALEREKAESGKIDKHSSLASMENVSFAELRSGESLLLE